MFAVKFTHFCPEKNWPAGYLSVTNAQIVGFGVSSKTSWDKYSFGVLKWYKHTITFGSLGFGSLASVWEDEKRARKEAATWPYFKIIISDGIFKTVYAGQIRSCKPGWECQFPKMFFIHILVLENLFCKGLFLSWGRDENSYIGGTIA